MAEEKEDILESEDGADEEGDSFFDMSDEDFERLGDEVFEAAPSDEESEEEESEADSEAAAEESNEDDEADDSEEQADAEEDESESLEEEEDEGGFRRWHLI